MLGKPRRNDVDPDELERRIKQLSSQVRSITVAFIALIVGCFWIGFVKAALGH
jgi:hypothetical protein